MKEPNESMAEWRERQKKEREQLFRDACAVQAMKNLLSQGMLKKYIPEEAFKLADAMVGERAKRESDH